MSLQSLLAVSVWIAKHKLDRRGGGGGGEGRGLLSDDFGQGGADLGRMSNNHLPNLQHFECSSELTTDMPPLVRIFECLLAEHAVPHHAVGIPANHVHAVLILKRQTQPCAPEKLHELSKH